MNSFHCWCYILQWIYQYHHLCPDSGISKLSHSASNSVSPNHQKSESFLSILSLIYIKEILCQSHMMDFFKGFLTQGKSVQQQRSVPVYTLAQMDDTNLTKPSDVKNSLPQTVVPAGSDRPVQWKSWQDSHQYAIIKIAHEQPNWKSLTINSWGL